MADLAGTDQVVQCRQRLVLRHRRVERVHLVEVDVVGAEPTKGCLNRIEDVAARRALLPRLAAHRADALGGQHHVVASARPCRQPLPHDLLRPPDRAEAAAERVDVGRVEEVDAGLFGRVEDGEARRLIALETEGHRPHAQAGDPQSSPAQSNVLHASDLTRRGGFCRIRRANRHRSARGAARDGRRGRQRNERGGSARLADRSEHDPWSNGHDSTRISDAPCILHSSTVPIRRGQGGRSARARPPHDPMRTTKHECTESERFVNVVEPSTRRTIRRAGGAHNGRPSRTEPQLRVQMPMLYRSRHRTGAVVGFRCRCAAPAARGGTWGRRTAARTTSLA